MNFLSTWIESAKQWQTLIASSIAIVAAGVAWYNTSRTLKANAELETKRRSQKHAALRAILPLSLSVISSYCSLTMRGLEELWGECVDGALPHNLNVEPTFPELPTETVKAFADFIEYSDALDTSLFRRMLARIQVSRARIAEVVRVIEQGDEEAMILEINIEEYILDAASIYAAAAAAFDYGREKTDTLPKELTWDQVRSSLRNMKVWEHDAQRLYATIERREADGASP
ncbi:hypothetical protein [Bradyrhizobium sp. WSM471]|uniref:hypothetical protein n=1 Tax=Bradyrhizobium sp. WSM471 TaxID=319017 RepID=UPI00024D2017|nr:MULTISPECIES: hypothetical protein [Bradyrhizobium]EHR01236.1 hypothetical protein Bra471DRAFT_01938 [Bradyrhizobium sp. WSM471]UFW43300.1 hypothetical protein BcanWSM471_09540 [Bradyrhizobium canariense]